MPSELQTLLHGSRGGIYCFPVMSNTESGGSRGCQELRGYKSRSQCSLLSQKAFSGTVLLPLATVKIASSWDVEKWERKKSKNNKAEEMSFLYDRCLHWEQQKSAILKAVTSLWIARLLYRCFLFACLSFWVLFDVIFCKILTFKVINKWCVSGTVIPLYPVSY